MGSASLVLNGWCVSAPGPDTLAEEVEEPRDEAEDEAEKREQ